MPTVIIKNGVRKQLGTTNKPSAKTVANTLAIIERKQCDQKQQAINAIYELAKGNSSKWAKYIAAKYKELGLVDKLNPTGDFAGQAICKRRSAAINEARQYAPFIKKVAEILKKYGFYNPDVK